jgi:hypothetical protein
MNMARAWVEQALSALLTEHEKWKADAERPLPSFSSLPLHQCFIAEFPEGTNVKIKQRQRGEGMARA